MNTGIFTFPNSISYGATLQMYALDHTVEALGHTPEVINYHNAYMKQLKHVGQRTRVYRILGALLHHRMHRKFRQFEKKNTVKYPRAAINDPQGLSELSKKYDDLWK